MPFDRRWRDLSQANACENQNLIDSVSANVFAKLFKNWPLRQHIIMATGCTILAVGLWAAEFVRFDENRAFERNFRDQTQELVSMLSAISLNAIHNEDRAALDNIIRQLTNNDANERNQNELDQVA